MLSSVALENFISALNKDLSSSKYFTMLFCPLNVTLYIKSRLFLQALEISHFRQLRMLIVFTSRNEKNYGESILSSMKIPYCVLGITFQVRNLGFYASVVNRRNLGIFSHFPLKDDKNEFLVHILFYFYLFFIEV